METRPELEELIAEAELGQEAKSFMESDLGKCLLGMAEQDIESARMSLEDVDPNDVKKITQFQNRAALGRMFKQYLIELFDRGNQAIEVFKHESS